MTKTTHDNFSHDEIAVVGSDCSFGIVMASFFAVLSLVNGWHLGRLWPWTAAFSALFLIGALLYPAVLNPLNRIWFKFGLLLHKVVNPVVMGAMFYGTVLPTGFIMRTLGKDLLRLKLQPNAQSYWIVRQPPGPASESFKDQF